MCDTKSSTTSCDRSLGKEILKKICSSEQAVILEKKIYDYIRQKKNTGQYLQYVYQIYGDILNLKDSELRTSLPKRSKKSEKKGTSKTTDKKDISKIIQNVEDGKLGWDNVYFSKISQELNEKDDFTVFPFEVAEGVSECPRCKCTKTWSVQKQTRGCDEPMTTFSKCVKCGKQWTYSG